MHFILCGPPKTGKSTLGKLVAATCSLPFVDLDKQMEKLFYVENSDDLTTRQIYQRIGEDAFRELEYRALLQLKERTNCVIATGAGCVCHAPSYHLLPSLGKIIYLETPLAEIYQRMQATSLPATLDQEDPLASLKKMWKLRESLYENLADYRIKTTHYSQDELVEKIVQIIFQGNQNHG